MHRQPVPQRNGFTGDSACGIIYRTAVGRERGMVRTSTLLLPIAALLAGCSALPEQRASGAPRRRRNRRRAACRRRAPARPRSACQRSGRWERATPRCPTSTSARVHQPQHRPARQRLVRRIDARGHQYRPGHLRGRRGLRGLGALRRRPRRAADPRLAAAQHRDDGQLLVPQRRRHRPPFRPCDRRGDRRCRDSCSRMGAGSWSGAAGTAETTASASSCAPCSKAPASGSIPCSGRTTTPRTPTTSMSKA